MRMDLPAAFREQVPRVFGVKGREWLLRLPDILARRREKWGLREGVPSPKMGLNYLEFTTTADGQPVARKVGVPPRAVHGDGSAAPLPGPQRSAPAERRP